MEIPVLVIIGARREPPYGPHLLAVEESWPLSAIKWTGQIGGCEIIFGNRIRSEGSTRYACCYASLDVDDARPFEKQRIAGERRVVERDERMEIPDGKGQRFDPGVVEIRLKQRRRSVRSVAEFGGNIKPEIIKRANEVEPATT